MEFVDLGQKSGGEIAPVDSKEKDYPSIRLTQKQFPALKNVNINENFAILADVVVTGIHKYGDGDIEYVLELKRAIITEDDPEDVKEEWVE